MHLGYRGLGTGLVQALKDMQMSESTPARMTPFEGSKTDFNEPGPEPAAHISAKQKYQKEVSHCLELFHLKATIPYNHLQRASNPTVKKKDL